MPLVGRHTSQNIFDAFVKVDDVVMPHCQDTLFSVSLDGARNMTGLDRGIVPLIRKAISPHGTILRAWCGAHQLDLLFQKVVSKMCNDKFYTTLTSMIGGPGIRLDNLQVPDWCGLRLFKNWVMRPT